MNDSAKVTGAGPDGPWWGFAVAPDLYRSAQALLARIDSLAEEDLDDWMREAFQVMSDLIFTGVACYYDQEITGRKLPPLAEGVAPEDAIQTIGLGLTFWAGRALQGRSLAEIRDLGGFLRSALRYSPDTDQAMLAIPLEPGMVQQLQFAAAAIRGATDLHQCQQLLTMAAKQAGLALVERYYALAASASDDPAHQAEVERYGRREAERTLDEMLAQLVPRFPQAHLVHFAHFMEAQIHRPRTGQ